MNIYAFLFSFYYILCALVMIGFILTVDLTEFKSKYRSKYIRFISYFLSLLISPILIPILVGRTWFRVVILLKEVITLLKELVDSNKEQ